MVLSRQYCQRSGVHDCLGDIFETAVGTAWVLRLRSVNASLRAAQFHDVSCFTLLISALLDLVCFNVGESNRARLVVGTVTKYPHIHSIQQHSMAIQHICESRHENNPGCLYTYSLAQKHKYDQVCMIASCWRLSERCAT